MSTPPSEKPRFCTALGAADTTLVEIPPFSFPGVTARVFPLRAKLNRLRQFCNSYLNVAPEVCTFHPYLPYVFLVVLDYGRMATEATNLGWISQHEIFFAVPLGKWDSSRRGQKKFRGWVVNTPFLFVDNATSLTTGREVYGWPKVLATLKPGLEEWLSDPRNPTRLLSLDVQGCVSHVRRDMRLLEIDHLMDQSISLYPPDAGADPLQRLSGLSASFWSVAWEAAGLVLRSPFSGYGRQDLFTDARVFFDSLRELSGLTQDPGLNCVMLKQFRDARDPALICYQALVQSRLAASRLNCSGLLGLYSQAQGDLTGGLRIRLHEHPSFPIVESLGLSVAARQMSSGRTVSILEPLFPFWLGVDLTLNPGETICWRTKSGRWHGRQIPVAPAKPKTRPLYNTVGGPGQEVFRGPFYIPDAHCDVFPLPADRTTLGKFVRSYLNVSERDELRAWGSHVFMVASRGRMFSQEISASWIKARQVSFYIPLLWFRSGRLFNIAMTRPFAFIDNPTLTMTLREVEGVPANDATLATPANLWQPGRPALDVQLSVFTALDEGLESQNRSLIRVSPDRPEPDLSAASEFLFPGWAQEIACGERSLPMVSLKQFRDAEQPYLACYQELVHSPWTFSTRQSMKPLAYGREIRVYRYPSLPLVDTLGLKVESVETPTEIGGAIAEILRPQNPFRIRLQINIGLANSISRSAGLMHLNDIEPHEAEGPQPLLQAALSARAAASRKVR